MRYGPRACSQSILERCRRAPLELVLRGRELVVLDRDPVLDWDLGAVSALLLLLQLMGTG